MMLNDVDRDYIKNNKIIIFLFIIWIFRQLFLLQANEGGVAINKFVVVQILTELGIFGYLLIKKNNFGTIVFFQPITWFAVLYILGMASIFWGVLPIMGCYFAFQNLLMLYAIYFLASKTKSVFQLERYYIFVNIFVLILFFLRSFFMYNHNYHSVSFSTIASLLFVYCITEFNTQKRPPENIKMLKIGFVVGFVFLVLTSSSGAIVSTVCGLFVLSLVAKNPMVRLGGILFFTIISICFLLGATERLIVVFFPNKSAEVI
ncbi:MAG: hypothetical protein IJZ27_03710, partial [Treponema sp.]|nr:hypothetical protein [Treponema sp.]